MRDTRSSYANSDMVVVNAKYFTQSSRVTIAYSSCIHQAHRILAANVAHPKPIALAADVAHRYDKCHLNFLSAVPTDLLEQLAMTTVSSQTSCEVERVYDMYTNFISLEVGFAHLRRQSMKRT